LAQAEENKSSVEAELILLTVHGTLHLLGYDHATVEDKEKMWAIQNEIVGKLT
jgi:probable rRNA maturation factor